jgi:WASH complex subunit CCDC53
MVKDDARFSKYFKMLNMGVPKAAVKMKMGAEGLDPDVLDLDPEAPAPAGGGSSQALVPLDGGGGGGDDDGNESEKSDNMSDDD